MSIRRRADAMYGGMIGLLIGLMVTAIVITELF